MAEKSEKATSKKLKDARKKGQVAKAQDLPSAFTFIISIWATLAMMGYIHSKVSGFLILTFSSIPKGDIMVYLPGMFYEAAIVIFLCSIPVMLLVSFIGVAINFLAVGPTFAPEVFKFDPKKFDPIQNLKAKFKMKTLFELVKSLFKITVASIIIYQIVYSSLPVLIKLVNQDIETGLNIYYVFLMQVVIKVGIFFIGIAVVDFVFQKYNFANEMKMEKFEVKQEYKNTEGDPQIKGKRRQLAQEIAYQEGPTGGIRNSKALVTNPTHLAIAIGYERDIDAAPYILAMGEGILAERMIAMAEKYDIPIIRNIALAHTLWENGDLYEFIPEETYEPVAEILRWIASLNEPKDDEVDID